MTEKDIIKITKMLLNSYNTSDVIFDITQEYPKYKDRIKKIVKEHDDSNDFEEKVEEKALELFVRDGNMSVHFPLKYRTKYYEKAREILNKEIENKG
jgi:hypothetical protein